MTLILIGLGSNLGDRRRHLESAVSRVAVLPRTALRSVSSVYETDPHGDPRHPAYLNAAVSAETDLAPAAVHRGLRGIEAELGRGNADRHRPRAVDLDLLAHGDMVMRTEDLELPHPRLADRPFVLVPLVEIEPAWRHPVLGLTAQELLRPHRRLTAVRWSGRLVLPRASAPAGGARA